jgi:hypothetical protein
MTLWVQGYPEQALERANEALTLAQHLEHPFTLARGLYWTSLLHQLRREWQVVSERAETDPRAHSNRNLRFGDNVLFSKMLESDQRGSQHNPRFSYGMLRRLFGVKNRPKNSSKKSKSGS